MNIFYLDRTPSSAARYHSDTHCVKMILETAQLLSTAHHVLGDGATYKKTHENHPCAVWIRESQLHYRWAYDLLVALCDEYTARYGKVHATARLLDELREPPAATPHAVWQDPPQCMPDEYKRTDCVEAYRAYYVGGKADINKWAHSPRPHWIE